MSAALADAESGEHAVTAIFLLVTSIIILALGIDGAPALLQDGAASGLEADTTGNGQHRGLGILAFGTEHGTETADNQVIDPALAVTDAGEAPGLACGDDGMVVSDAAVVKHPRALGQRLPRQSSGGIGNGGQLLDDAGAFRIDVIGEVLGVHTRIGGQLLLIEALDVLQRGVCREAVLAVAVHLQRGEVVELGRLLADPALADVLDAKHVRPSRFQPLPAPGLAVETTLGTGEDGIAVPGGQYPVRDGREMLYLVVAGHYHGERGRLHAPDAEHLPVAAILQCVETGDIHA